MNAENLRSQETLPNFAVEKVLVAGNRGPCGGVNMALGAVEEVLDLVDGREPIYTNWNIVNNKPEMEELAERDLVNVRNDLEAIPDGSILFFSAHGVPPRFHEIAREKNLLVIDVTCQLVTRVHNLVKRAERLGKHTVYIGVEGHPETIGVMGEVRPEHITLVQSFEEAGQMNLPAGREAIVFSQTTLLPDEVEKIEDALRLKVPDIEIPNKRDICFAMYNRQEAVKHLLAEGIDMLIVVGSKDSQNSQMYRSQGEMAGLPSYSIDYPYELEDSWFDQSIRKVGATSGASVQEKYLEPVLGWFRERLVAVEYRSQVIEEEEKTFVLPKSDIEALKHRYAP